MLQNPHIVHPPRRHDPSVVLFCGFAYGGEMKMQHQNRNSKTLFWGLRCNASTSGGRFLPTQPANTSDLLQLNEREGRLSDSVISTRMSKAIIALNCVVLCEM